MCDCEHDCELFLREDYSCTFLRGVVRVAGAQASADLYHCSAMVWGGALAAALEPCARTRAGEPRAWRSRGGAQQRRGGFGTQGVTGVLRDGLSAKR